MALPDITIEIFFGGSENPLMNGNANSDRDNSAEGFCFRIAFNDKYADEYEALVQRGNVKVYRLSIMILLGQLLLEIQLRRVAYLINQV